MRTRAACSDDKELTRLRDFGKTRNYANYGWRGSCRSRARRCRSRFAREGETKSQYVTAIESKSAAMPSSNCQPVPTRTFFEIPAFSNAGGAFCDRRTAMLLAKPGAGKRRGGPRPSAGSH